MTSAISINRKPPNRSHSFLQKKPILQRKQQSGQTRRPISLRRLKMECSRASTFVSGRVTSTRGIITATPPTVNPPPVDISIPGFNNLSGGMESHCRRRFWVVAIVASIFLCTLLIAFRINDYLKAPVSIRIDIFEKQRLSFPAVTICPFYPFSFNREINQLRDQYASLHNITHSPITYWNDSNSIYFLDLLDLPGVNVTQLWRLGGMTKGDMQVFRACQFETKKNCDVPIEVEEVITHIGVCLTVKFASKLNFDGSYNGLELKIHRHGSDSSYWQHLILLHHPKEMSVRSLHENKAQPMHPFREISVYFFIKKYIRLNTGPRPCMAARDVRSCFSNCFRRTIVRNITCRLPFMTLPIGNLPLCNSSTAAKQAYDSAKKTYTHADTYCGHCPRRCVQNRYVMFQDVVMRKNCTWPKILMQDNFVEVITENESYTFGVLLSEIGGCLGLFLGACLLTLLQVMEAFALYLVKAVKKAAK